MKTFKEFLNEALSWTSAASLYTATRKPTPNPGSTSGFRVGDTVEVDGKRGTISFIHGSTVHVQGLNPYYPKSHKVYRVQDIKKVEESQ